MPSKPSVFKNNNSPQRGSVSNSSTISSRSTSFYIGAVILLTVLYSLRCFSGVLFAEESKSAPAPPQIRQQGSSTTDRVSYSAAAANKQPPTPASSPTDYQIAYDESFGFFNDIPSKDWELMRKITLASRDAQPTSTTMDQPNKWYQFNWDPDFSCRHDTKIGSGDGTKWVCDPHRIAQQSKRRMEEYHEQQQQQQRRQDVNVNATGCIVYSVGSHGNFQFERGLAKMLPSCEIHTFDFEPKYGRQVPEGNRWNIHYHSWGFKPSYVETKNTRDGKYGQADPNLGEFKTFQETKKILGHEGRPIDIFKIDCEGCEWTTFRDWTKGAADIRQVLVEVHRSPEVAVDFFHEMQSAGYVIFHKEPNIASTDGNCLEYGFLKLDRSYVQNKIKSNRPK